jgi:hypothetical protein
MVCAAIWRHNVPSGKCFLERAMPCSGDATLWKKELASRILRPLPKFLKVASEPVTRDQKTVSRIILNIPTLIATSGRSLPCCKGISKCVFERSVRGPRVLESAYFLQPYRRSSGCFHGFLFRS